MRNARGSRLAAAAEQIDQGALGQQPTEALDLVNGEPVRGQHGRLWRSASR